MSQHALLSPPPRGASPSLVLRNFMRMTLFFSVNHGCVTAVLNLAPVLLGERAGSFQTASLYVTYAATAMLASTAIIAWLGTRRALVLGTAQYCLYVASLPVALLFASDDTAKYAVAVIGGGVGGVAAGFLWAAQGAYFAATAKLYAAAKGEAAPAVSAKFAAYFGGAFLSSEVVLKLLPLALKAFPGLGAAPKGGLSPADLAVAVLYSGLAVLSSALMPTVWDLDRVAAEARGPDAEADDAGGRTTQGAGSPPPRPHPLGRVTAALGLCTRSPLLALLAPTQAAFGMCSALLGDEIAAKVVPAAYPDDKVVVAGLCSALVALVAAALQLPSRWVAERAGKPAVMLVGLLAFGGLGLVALLNERAQLEALPLLLACYVLQGVGRASYEGTNKALYADFFPDDAPAAFSNIVLANGLASAAAFFAFPSLSREQMAAATLVVVAVAIVGYVAAELVHRRARAAAPFH